MESGRSSWLRKGDWLVLRTIARCESPWIRFAVPFGTLFVMPGDDGLQGLEEDVFLDGLLPLSSCTSEMSTVASTPRERAQYGLRGDKGQSWRSRPAWAGDGHSWAGVLLRKGVCLLR